MILKTNNRIGNMAYEDYLRQPESLLKITLSDKIDVKRHLINSLVRCSFHHLSRRYS